MNVVRVAPACDSHSRLGLRFLYPAGLDKCAGEPAESRLLWVAAMFDHR